ncbi:MAG: glycosyltransferase family 9 protein [Flavobacteriales bacterium]|nr:glycosyltransferase family 9 protein [Flavobacteriales bacterium]
MKILIIRLSSIGDIVLTTPVVRCLKKQLPAGTQIHYLTKPGFKVLLDQNPYLDKIHTYADSIKSILRILREENYDVVVDLHNNMRTRRIRMNLKGKTFVVNKINLRKFLLTSFKINILPSLHIVDRYLETVKELKVFKDGEGLDYFYPANFESLKAFCPTLERGRYIVAAIGGQHFTKKMPPDKLKEIFSKTNLPVVLIGGKEDMHSAELIKEQDSNIVSLCGKLSLHESAGIIENSRVILTHDTGMMHFAAALKKPVIVLWGNTVPQFGMYPYYGDHKVDFKNFEVYGLGCRPCSKIGYDRCPKGHFKCMNNQDIQGISNALNAF